MRAAGYANQRAFSLVELLIAFFVLLIGVLAVLVLFPLGLRESKSMVDASMAAFEARNARSMMEVHTFSYHGDGMVKTGYGSASMVQAKFPVRVVGDVTQFPVMFPLDVLGNNDDPNGIFPLTQRPADCVTNRRERVVDPNSPQYSWDARFNLGGGPGLTPPAGFQYATMANWQSDYFWWFDQYYKYYAVQISVYRNYKLLTPQAAPGNPSLAGTVWLHASPKPGGGNYDLTDPNRPMWSEIVLTTQAPLDLVVGSAIRVRDDKSDWYRVAAISFTSNQMHLKLDRPYAGLALVDNNGNPISDKSAAKADIIATNSLIDSFTTILGSQLDDVDSTTTTYP